MLLVTGAAGFIGSHLCERLVADGDQVVGVDCFSDYYDRTTKESNLAGLRSASFRLVEADLNEVSMISLLDGIDGVFHLAGQPGVRGSWGEGFGSYLRANVEATQRLLEAVRRRPVPVVLASSSSVYGNAERQPVSEDQPLQPVSPYGVTKLAAENLALVYAREHRLSVTALRYFTVYGPRQRPDMAFSLFLRAALSGDQIRVLGDGEQSRDFTFVTDAVDATVRALDAATPAVYNIGGGSVATVNHVLELIEDLTGQPISVERRERAAGDVAHTWADTSRARAALGWCPHTTLEDGLRAQAGWASSREPAARRAS
jgi:UDP-glucuronate 4-epimerase